MEKFSNLARTRDTGFSQVLARYPVSVQEHVKRLLLFESADGPAD